jgi:hypothetical protein
MALVPFFLAIRNGNLKVAPLLSWLSGTFFFFSAYILRISSTDATVIFSPTPALPFQRGLV